MKIRKATRLYEQWLAERIDLVPADLALKHRAMAGSRLQFLRATFYRWAQLFPSLCAEVAGAAPVLAVGDLHVENFGTWRDAEGRLVWGVNDFDEACELPWTNDLVRLAVSADLAVHDSGLHLRKADACDALLKGYAAALEAGGRPFVLDDDHRWLHDLAHNRLRDPHHFWSKLEGLAWRSEDQVPRAVASRLRDAMPRRGLPLRIAHRVAGLGSLGRPRYLAVAEWCGGRVARETKPLCASASAFAAGDGGDQRVRYRRIIAGAVRVADPCLSIDRGWVVRRLSPSCSRVELTDLPRPHDESRLLEAMGWETANVHLGTRGARKAIRAQLAERKSGWLHEAVECMADAVAADFRSWAEAPADAPGDGPPVAPGAG